MEVSVVIPHYNSSDLLLKALKSIDQQTYLPKEVIVVDDCSTPIHTAALLGIENLTFQFVLIFLFQKVNKGAPAARNIGIRYAKYDYIALLDADDCWVNNKLEQQISAIGDCDLLYGRYRSFESEVRHIALPELPSLINYFDILKKNLSPVTLLMKREAFIPFDERLRRCDDFKMSLEALYKGRTIGFLNMDLAYGFKKSVGESGLTGSLIKMSLSFIHACLLVAWECPRLSFLMVFFVFFEVLKFPIRCLKVLLKK